MTSSECDPCSSALHIFMECIRDFVTGAVKAGELK